MIICFSGRFPTESLPPGQFFLIADLHSLYDAFSLEHPSVPEPVFSNSFLA